MNNTPPPVTDHHGPISIGRIHVPLAATITAGLIMLSGVVSFSLVWYKTVNHSSDDVVHVSQPESIKGGGVAYKADVQQQKYFFERELGEQHKKTRRLIKSMQIRCRARGGGDMSCTVDLPESVE